MSGRRRHGDDLVLMLVGMIVLFGGFVAWILFAANADVPRSHALAERQAIERSADDVSWLVLKDAARRHLAAVRSDAATLPDAELGSALLDYSQNGRWFFRTPRKDPTERLAALKTAAAALDDPADPVRCHHHDRTKDDPRCETYMKALTAVFGRDL